MKNIMVGVPGSSGSGSSASGTERTFDVHSEHDLLQLLQFIRRGPFEPSEKSGLRDAVLDYAAGKDEAVLTELAAQLSAKKVTLTKGGAPVGNAEHAARPANSPAAPKTPAGLGSRRPQPNFNTPNTASQGGAGAGQPTPAPTADKGSRSVPVRSVTTEDAASTAKDAQPAAPTRTPAAASKAEEASVPDTAQPAAASAQAGQHQDAQPSAIPEPAQPQKTAAQSAIPEPASAAASDQQTPPPTTAAQSAAVPETSVPEPGPQQEATSSTVKDPLERIKEIKRKINEKVGNPVNLIDANNEVGREYMNALLNAMRVVGSGSAEDTSLAMDRLEKAFSEVKRSIESGETVIGEKKAAPTPPPEPATPKAPAPETGTSVPPADGPSAIPSSGVAAPAGVSPAAPQAVTEDRKPEPSDPAVAPTPSISQVPKPTTESAASPTAGVAVPTPEPQTPPQPQAATESASSPMQQLAEDVKLPQQEAQEPPRRVENVAAQTTAAASETQSDTPLSIAEKLRQKQASQQSLLRKRATELDIQQQQQEQTDPLHSNAVSAGLQQLLSEWKLFKSSGIFGTGPSGYEHPLYKQLSALPMSAIIAGRFEGATPEIKQSITDYMNGWRYEQGVVHEMNETFEHYLRRVVKEILDKQKAPKA